MLSQTSIYVIRAFIYLAVQNKEHYVGAAAVARDIGAPQNYLGKVLQQFVLNEILESQRGAGGGLRLSRRPDSLSLFDIVEPLEHLSSQPQCFMGQLCCGPLPCEHHAAWERLHGDYVRFLKKVTISDLVKQNSIDTGNFIMPGIKGEANYADNS